MIGSRLSHFEIVGQIGSGGMGVVYRANDLRLKRTVALKLLATMPADASEPRERLLREARAASALNHPNIVTVFEADSCDGVDFIAMELVEGQSLDCVIPVGGWEPAIALSYAIQIAAALTHAHDAGIVHRDLKPRNLILTPEGRVKVLDFGIAKRGGAERGTSDPAVPTQSIAAETQAGVVLGTPQYMSPEQAQGQRVDARSDIFSFGIVLYQMLTGAPPFRGENVAQLVSAILRDEAPPLRASHRGIPRALDRIVARTLRKAPSERYQRMADVLADLERAAHREARISIRQALVAAALLLVTAGGLFLALRPRADRSPSPPPRFRLLSTFPGSHRAPSLSPDGRLMAYVDASRGVPQIFVKQLAGGDPVQITNSEVAAGRPRWSPKGDLIVFELRRRGLWAVPPLGGTPRQIVEIGSCHNFFPDGNRLVFDRERSVWTALLDGTDARRVEGVPENYYSFYVQHCAAVSPDGKLLAYYQPERGPSGDLWTIPVTGGTPRRLTSDLVEAADPLFAPDGHHVIFSSARSGSRTLWRVALAGGVPESLTTGAGEDVEPDVSADGRMLVYANLRNSYVLMVLDPASGNTRELIERRQHTNGAVVSPDGRRVAFFAATDEGTHVFTIAVDGTGVQQLTSGKGQENIMPRWSGDGAWLYFYSRLPLAFRRLPAAGGQAETVIDGWRFETQYGGSVDPAGRRVAYSLLREGNPVAARVRDLGDGRETALALHIWGPHWSRDGLSLIGFDEQGVIEVCPADGSPCRRLGTGSQPRWSWDGRRVYFEKPGPELDDPSRVSSEVWSMGAGGDSPRPVATLLPAHALGTPFDVLPSGEIVWIHFRRGKEELWAAEWSLP